MESTLIVLSIPIFLAFIGGELLVARARGRRLYQFADSIANLGNGIGEQIIQAFCIPVTVGVYAWVYAHARLHTLTPSLVTWVILFFAVDFLYYAYHRASHRVNFLWAGHVVHHQSEEYNFSVALRQSWFGQQLTEWVFFLPLALAGFPPSMFVVTLTLNTLYQFFIHTRLVGTLGPLEWIMNTPSHHRVHHGKNVAYLDRNHAGIFILWDRLFGTFEPERERVVYGLTKDIATFNPLRIGFHEVAAIARDVARAPAIGAKVGYVLRPPGWSHDGSTQTARQLRDALSTKQHR
jgi:alkylglycerol monooxygenase